MNVLIVVKVEGNPIAKRMFELPDEADEWLDSLGIPDVSQPPVGFEVDMYSDDEVLE